MRKLLLAGMLVLAGCGASPSFDEAQIGRIPPGRWDPQPFVYVMGEVNRPGRYRMIAPTTLTDVIIAAGGFTSLAYKGGIEVRRHAYDGRTVVVRIDEDAILEGKTPDVPLYPGDTVMVTGRYY
jgi:protein involved in polysaccharide export with SLBB domain